MATIGNDPNGRKRTLFVPAMAAAGRSGWGSGPEERGAILRTRGEDRCEHRGGALDDETSRWLA